MTRTDIWKRGGVALALGVALAGCQGREETAEPEDASVEGPRSIFQDDTESGGAAAETLPPLSTTLSFADGTPLITEAVGAELATIMESPQVAAGGAIVLRGHTDSRGGDADNLEASRLQAEAVRDFLIEGGVAEERISVIAFGEQNPAAPNALPDGSPNEEGRALNRRVEVTVQTGQRLDREQTLIESLTEGDEAGAETPATASSKATGASGNAGTSSATRPQ